MQFVINALIAASVYALTGISFALILRPSRFFHIAHGAVLTWGAYFTYTSHVLLGFPLLPSIVLAVGMTAALGATLEFAVYRWLRQHATSLVLLIASLGLYVVLQGMISLLFGERTRILRAGAVAEGVIVLGARITGVQILTALASFVVVLAVGAMLRGTRLGKIIRAVADDPQLASVSGIPTDRVILCAFTVGSGLAGLTGILLALDVGMFPTMGMSVLLMGVVSVIIGGVESVLGVALGGLLLAMAQSLAAWKVGSEWQDVIAFVILLAFLFVRPEGFLGKKAAKATV